MSPSDSQACVVENAATRALRRVFRWYRNSSVPLGHSLLRRLFATMIPERQTITLRNGMRLRVDLKSAIQSTIFWYDGDMEPQLSWAIREFLPIGGTFVDCGANCGYAGLEARLLRSAKVLFIEPHPELGKVIEKNVEINGWNDACVVVKAAASDQIGTCRLFTCSSYDGSHSLLPDWWPNAVETKPVEVPALTLSSILEKHDAFRTVSFLKIDTEGHDFAVLKGLGEMLHPTKIHVIYAELGRDHESACRLLEARGYVGFGYRPFPSATSLRKALRRYGDGRKVALFIPLSSGAKYNETFWVPKSSAEEAHLYAALKYAAQA